jgi:carbamoyltransferase|tara:strand:+ start:785 stop:1354 length:570 start_codon:yes stop_codon:yes gene_type:complete
MKYLKNIPHRDIAKLLLNNKIVGLFQGRSEAGSRALGNRSLLMSPLKKENKNIMNKFKKREMFRPLAASVLQQEASKWFDMLGMKESPYMSFSFKCIGNKNKIPSVIHVDNTCRIQTVTKKQNKNYYNIINEFYKLSKVPMILNTSFNLAGDPLIENIEDALNTFKKSNLEYLYLPELKILFKNDNCSN